MYNIFKIFLLLTLLLNLIACSDNVPTTISPNFSNQASNATGKLHLDIPSLKEWKNELKMTIGDTVELLATLENPHGKSLPNQTLFISSEKGNFFTENNLLTDHNGQATSLFLATVLGKDRIILTNQTGLSVSLSVTVNDELNTRLSSFFMKVAQASILKERNPNGLFINS